MRSCCCINAVVRGKVWIQGINFPTCCTSDFCEGSTLSKLCGYELATAGLDFCESVTCQGLYGCGLATDGVSVSDFVTRVGDTSLKEG